MNTKEHNFKELRENIPTIDLTVNNQNIIVILNNSVTAVIAYDKDDNININVPTNSNSTISFINSSFYTNIRHVYIPEYSPDIIQYYHVSEEQIFQYNTIMDYNLLQAMVHIHDYVEAKRNTNSTLLDPIIELLEDNHSSNYTITIDEIQYGHFKTHQMEY